MTSPEELRNRKKEVVEEPQQRDGAGEGSKGRRERDDERQEKAQAFIEWERGEEVAGGVPAKATPGRKALEVSVVRFRHPEWPTLLHNW